MTTWESSAPRRVLLVLPVLHPSGAERVVAELARRLPAHGFQSSVLCLEDPGAAVGVELKAAGVPVDGLRMSRRRTLACAAGIAGHIKDHFADQPLVVCAQLFHANIAARLALRHLSIKERGNIRVLTTVQVAERRFRPWQFWLDRVTARHGAGEICVARCVAQFQRERTGLPEAFFHVIENGIDLTRFTRPDAEKNFKQSNESEQLRVVSVGRLDPQKDFFTLLRAWQSVESRIPHATLEIAGSGTLESSLHALSAKLKLKRCRLIGFCADVPGLLRGAALYVQSSAWEGLPLAVIEALASGVPVIASAVDSLPDIIDDGVTGFLFQPRDCAELADKICGALANLKRAGAIGQTASEAALKRFSAERMVAEYAALFRRMLATEKSEL